MAHTVRKALPNTLIPFVSPTVNAELLPKSRSLYETLSRLPNDGVGLRVYQTRWEKKGIAGCFWEVSRVQLKNKGVNGKAWGRLVWRGKVVSEKEERIPGSLKYNWANGVSKGTKLPRISDIFSGPISQWKAPTPLQGETETEMWKRLTEEARTKNEKYLSRAIELEKAKILVS